MARRTASVLFTLVIGLSGIPAFAQEAPSTEAPAHIALVDGSAVLERDGQVDSDPTSMPLIAGDRLRTQGGRVEVLFADGSALHLDANTVVDFQSDEVIRLLEGRIRLAINGPARDVSYRVDAASAWVQITDPGEYRVSVLRDADVELAVLRGAAELVNEQGRSFIRAGERTFARAGAAPSAPYVYNSAAWDAFDRWSESRRDRRLGVSSQYLPSDVRPYAASLDGYGDWRYEQMYGYVWYPRVYTGWRPYHRGRWASLRPYGWTWIAADPWGWPTHHYGRWGISGSSWFWIPGRHWSPAWVSWAYATDYVSWCPLGWNNRPVLQIVNINVFGGRRYSPWDGWTVVPRRHFGGHFVNVRSVAAVRIDQRIHNTFVVADRAPEARFAVGRSAPIRSAGRYAVPRGSTGGALTSDSRSIPAREGVARTDTATGDRRSPAPSRPSRMSPSGPGSATDRQVPAARGTGERAVSRDRSAPDQAITSPERAAGESEYRRVPGARRPSRESTERAVTPAPEGAVRAVPRVQQPADAGTSDPRGSSREGTRFRGERAPVTSAPDAAAVPSTPRVRQRSESAPLGSVGSSEERTRARGERIPIYSAPQPNPSAARPSSPDREMNVYRSNPDVRRAPDSGGESRGRAVPRTDPPQERPSYRSAPEQRREPSGPPPSAGPSQQRPSGGDRATGGDRASGGRQRSGEARSSGQGSRRR